MTNLKQNKQYLHFRTSGFGYSSIRCTRHWYWITLGLVMLSAAAIRIQLLGVPLERDEGEYAYAGQLILQGIAPFTQVYNMKMPGIYAAYALVMAVFGETHQAIHLGLLFVNAATTLLLFLLTRKFFNDFAGLCAAASFAFLSLAAQLQGVFAHAEHFVVLAAIAGIILLVRALDSNKRSLLFASSVLLGLAFIMKQHGAAFIVFGGAYLLYREIGNGPVERGRIANRSLIFLAGVTLPFAVTCLILFQAGVFENFWFWTFTYAGEYVSAVPFSVGAKRLALQISAIAGPYLVIWLLAVLGLTALAWNRKRLGDVVFAGLFVLFSVLAVFPGFYFRPHYFVLLLPGVSMLAGIGARSLLDVFGSWKAIPLAKLIPAIFVLAGLLQGLWHQRAFLFAEATAASRMVYGLNPFPESLEIARFIRENSNPESRVAVFGSEPQIYFYADRHAATGYIYTYALMEPQPYALDMQKEMIREIQEAEPEYLVFVNIPTSWLVRADSQKLIFNWFEKYSRLRYERAGLADIGPNETKYVWNREAVSYLPSSPYWVSIFRRRK